MMIFGAFCAIARNSGAKCGCHDVGNGGYFLNSINLLSLWTSVGVGLWISVGLGLWTSEWKNGSLDAVGVYL